MLLEFCRLEFWETAFPFKAPQWRMQERCEWFLVSNSCRGISLILFKGGLSRPLFRLFWVFFKQAIHFRYNISWSCLSSIRCKDSNPRSLEHESCHNHWTRVPAHRFHSSFILVSEKWIFTFLQKLDLIKSEKCIYGFTLLFCQKSFLNQLQLQFGSKQSPQQSTLTTVTQWSHLGRYNGHLPLL